MMISWISTKGCTVMKKDDPIIPTVAVVFWLLALGLILSFWGLLGYLLWRLVVHFT